MAVTQNSYTGNGSATTYSFTFPYLKTADIKAQIDATVTTAFTLPTATTLQFNTAPANGAKIKIYRETADDTLTATFYAGSAIKSEDLNDNFTQNLYTTQEVNARFLSNLGGTMVGDLTMDEDADIVFEGATADAHETRLTVADPTADRTVTLPNVTGTVITTGDTGTIATAMLADDAVTTAKLATDSVGTDALANNAVDTGAIAADAVTGAKIADDQINSEHYVDGSIDTAHIADSQITTAKIANDAITQAKIADDAVGADQLAGNSVVSASIVDGTIVAGDIASNAITNAKMADDSVGAAELIDTSVGTAALASNAVTLAKMADSSVGTAELVADAVTGAKIADNAIDSEHYTDGSIDRVHLAADIVDGTKIADDAIDSEHYTDGSIDTAHIADDAVTTAKIADDAVGTAAIAANAVTTSEIADAELTTLAGMQSGTASILAGSTALTATLAEINTVVDGKGVHTTISDSDAHYPTSGAVVDYVAAQIAPIGGLEVIANEDSFPATQPASGVVISIADAAGVVVNGSGVSTSARTSGSGSDNVTINGFPSSLYSETLASGNGLMVTSTGSGHTYNYHKLLASESDVKQLSDDINDFNSRYRINAGEPSSNNDDGDLCWDTNADKMKVYDGTASAWKEVTSSGDFKFLVPVDAGTTTAATWDGSDTSFDLKEGTNSGSAASVTSVYQLMISVNGVVQKPNTGSYSASEEGFYLTDSDTIRFCTAPPTGSSVFVVQFGSALTISTPGDNTVATAKIQNSAVTTDKVADNAITGAKVSDNLDIPDNNKIRFGTGNDLFINHNGTDSNIINATGDLYIQNSGDDIQIRAQDDIQLQVQNGETGINIIGDGAVELYHNNVKKLQTTANGVEITAAEGASAGLYLTADEGDDNGDKWSLYADDGSTINLVNYASGGWEKNIECNGNGNVELYYDNTKKLETYSGGVIVTGTLNVPDGSSSDNRITLGSGGDLKLYHDGTNTYIDNDTGILRVQGDDLRLTAGNNEAYFVGTADGASELYYNGSKKAETRSDGFEIKDHLTMGDSDEIRLGNSSDLKLYHDGSNSYITNSTGQFAVQGDDLKLRSTTDLENYIVCTHNGAVDLYHNGSKKFETTSTGVQVSGTLKIPDNDGGGQRLDIGSGTDLQIYHNGTNTIIDNNTGDLYIGSGFIGLYNAALDELKIAMYDNGAVNLYYDHSVKLATANYGVRFYGILEGVDNEKVQLGSSGDLKLYHDGSDSYIDDTGTGQLRLCSNQLAGLNAAHNEYTFKATENGAVELYYDNVVKAKTASTGFHINDGNLTLNDNQKVSIGTGNDLQLYHTGTNSYIRNLTGDLYIQTNDGSGNAETGIALIPNGATELYYNNIRTLATGSSGVAVYGAEGGASNLYLYADEGDDNGDKWRIQSEAANSAFWVQNYAAGAWETAIKAIGNGSLQLFYDNSEKIKTTSAGVEVTSNVSLPDSGEARFGASNDLKLYHASGNSFVANVTGYLNIKTTNGGYHYYDADHHYFRAENGENLANFRANAGCFLYYDNAIKLETDSTGTTFHGRIIPSQDDAYLLGNSSYKWSEVYAGEGTIQTSDRNEKNTIVESDLGLDFVNKLKPVSYKWNKPTKDNTRYGLIAQDVEEALLTEGKTLKDFDGLRNDDGKYGLNYSEFISPLIKAVQELTEEVKVLKTKIATLEAE